MKKILIGFLLLISSGLFAADTGKKLEGKTELGAPCSIEILEMSYFSDLLSGGDIETVSAKVKVKTPDMVEAITVEVKSLEDTYPLSLSLLNNSDQGARETIIVYLGSELAVESFTLIKRPQSSESTQVECLL